MEKSVFIKILLLLVLLVGAFLGGVSYNRSATGEKNNAPGQRRILHYVDPMNPTHTSDKPGVAPCGMPLEPVYADEESTGGLPPSHPQSPGTVKISTQKQQLIGVQVGKVEEISETHTIRTLGRVAPDENLTYRILSGADGWIKDVVGGTTGSMVKKDQLLATSYNSQLVPRGQQYLNVYTLEAARLRQIAQFQAQAAQQNAAQPPGETQEAAGQGQSTLAPPYVPPANPAPTQPQVIGGFLAQGNPLELAKLELYSLGVGDYQLQELERTRQIASELQIRSPATGIVLARNISPLQRFDKSVELFKIADISHVWVLADVYEREAQYIRPGTGARISLPRQGKVFEARVSDVLPQFDPTTRSFKVRLELDNPDMLLLPDMFVDVDFLITLPPASTVAADAVLDSGLRKVVFVSLGNGYFEPRTIETGWRFGDRVQVVSGIMPGDEVVVSGTFLIDSESRMKLAQAGLYGTPVKDPVCGMDAYPGKAKKEGLTIEFEGKTYYFCSAHCKGEFEKRHGAHMDMTPTNAAPHEGHMEMPPANPAQHSATGGEKESMPAVVKDPTCGMPVQRIKAKSTGLTTEYQGTTYFFCSGHCKEQFDKAPQQYVDKISANPAHQDAPNQGEHHHD
jgi:YHS domain-containing protein/multidrug efflux pump subunit AcrA (membrane-fusion protein)